MKTVKMIQIIVLLFLLAFSKNEASAAQNFGIFTRVFGPDTFKQNKINYLKQLKRKSFVVSCGGGCAMTYTAAAITKSGSCFKVTFKVEM